MEDLRHKLDAKELNLAEARRLASEKGQVRSADVSRLDQLYVMRPVIEKNKDSQFSRFSLLFLLSVWTGRVGIDGQGERSRG
jgi:hypothetical protein